MVLFSSDRCPAKVYTDCINEQTGFGLILGIIGEKRPNLWNGTGVGSDQHNHANTFNKHVRLP